MEGKKGNNFIDFSTAGMIFGVLLLIVSVIWVALNMISDDSSTPEDITWVG